MATGFLISRRSLGIGRWMPPTYLTKWGLVDFDEAGETLVPRPLRAELFDPNEVCIVHCVQRCVRRAFLAGEDPVSGKNYEFLREWIRERLECIASIFGVDVLTYAILSNHMHVILRTRPDVVSTWSDQEIARRWLSLFPGQRVDEFLGQPSVGDGGDWRSVATCLHAWLGWGWSYWLRFKENARMGG